MDLSSISDGLLHMEPGDAATGALLDAIAAKIHENANDPNTLHELADSIISNKDGFIAAANTEPPEPVEEVSVEDDVEEEDDDEDESESEYAGHTVDELKEFLTERDLPVSGTKAELIARLEEADGEEGE